MVGGWQWWVGGWECRLGNLGLAGAQGLSRQASEGNHQGRMRRPSPPPPPHTCRQRRGGRGGASRPRRRPCRQLCRQALAPLPSSQHLLSCLTCSLLCRAVGESAPFCFRTKHAPTIPPRHTHAPLTPTRTPLAALFDALGRTLLSERSVLLLYALLHGSPAFHEYCLVGGGCVCLKRVRGGGRMSPAFHERCLVGGGCVFGGVR